MNQDSLPQLSAQRIRGRLSPAATALLRELTVLPQIDSTNLALSRLPPDRRHGHALLAETQLEGRGRRQRSWYSPAGNIYLSVGWRLDGPTGSLATLSLVAAVCVCRALEAGGLRGHVVKWPNDILVDGAKLAGILVETQSIGGGPALAVIGVGLNMRIPASAATDVPIDQPWTDLATTLARSGIGIERDEAAALLLDELLVGLDRFGREGFEPFRTAWEARDLLRGKRVRVEGGNGARSGTAQGIDEDGRLLVDFDGEGRGVVHAGDVSVRDE